MIPHRSQTPPSYPSSRLISTRSVMIPLTSHINELKLQQTILERVADKAIRFYREPTFFFDE